MLLLTLSADMTWIKSLVFMEQLITEEMCLDWYCYAKEEMTFDGHPLSFQKLEKAQCADKSLQKILQMDNSPYQMHSFHGGNNKGTYLQKR